EQSATIGNATAEATGQRQKRAKNDVSDREAVVLGSGNLGLIYLMEEPRRLTLEEIERRHPQLLPALRNHPHVGWLLVRSDRVGPIAVGRWGTRYLSDGRVEGGDPLANFSHNAPRHLLRTDGFELVADIMVGSFYDHESDEGSSRLDRDGIGRHDCRRGSVDAPRRLPAEVPSSARPGSVHLQLRGLQHERDDQ